MFCVRQTTATRLSTAGLLEEVIPARHEVLEFVLPQKDRVWRFRKLAPKPCPLKNQLQDDVDQPAGLMAVFQQRKIADDDLPLVRRLLRREGCICRCRTGG